MSVFVIQMHMYSNPALFFLFFLSPSHSAYGLPWVNYCLLAGSIHSSIAAAGRRDLQPDGMEREACASTREEHIVILRHFSQLLRGFFQDALPTCDVGDVDQPVARNIGREHIALGRQCAVSDEIHENQPIEHLARGK